MPRVQHGRAMEREAGPEHDRRRERERDPLPAAELKRRHHRQQHQRDGQVGQRHEQSDAQWPDEIDLPVGFPRSAAQPCSRSPRRCGPVRRAHVTRVVRNRCELRRVVDVRGNTVELVELLLHPRRARGAGHAADLELDAAGVSTAIVGLMPLDGTPTARMNADPTPRPWSESTAAGFTRRGWQPVPAREPPR